MSIELEKRVSALEIKMAQQSTLIEDLLEEKWALAAIRHANPDAETWPASVVRAIVEGENPVKVFRKYRGFTQEKLAELCDTSTAYISQIETGHRSAGLELSKSLADALDVDIDDLS